MNKYLKEITEKQCEFVNVEYHKINFKKDFWFQEYYWTEETEDEFKKWLIDYMTNNKEARKELMTFPGNNKKDLELFVENWVNNYGWEIK